MAEIDQHNVTGDKGRKKITLLDDEYDDESDEIRVDDGEEPRADSTTTTSSYRSPGGRRDEVIEVRKMSSKDTNRLRLWRIIVTGVLLLTAFAITYTTFVLLKNQEDDNFRTAVSIALQPFFHRSLCTHWSLHPYRFLYLDCSLNSLHEPSVTLQ